MEVTDVREGRAHDQEAIVIAAQARSIWDFQQPGRRNKKGCESQPFSC
jgi:hypothetical protein